ncbi:hypothetical protein LWM68_01150 [Niabella sp. W65]|nr:hypothetical protein [Niabella sp. W65]MCH7361511.1 hypothetical protein [Niabella sp. W65]
MHYRRSLCFNKFNEYEKDHCFVYAYAGWCYSGSRRPEGRRIGDFKYGGWTAPYGDEAYGKVVQEELQPASYLLGRKTFEIWEQYWPLHKDYWPGINEGENMYYLQPGMNLNGITPVLLQRLQIFGNSNNQPDPIYRYGVAAN